MTSKYSDTYDFQTSKLLEFLEDKLEANLFYFTKCGVADWIINSNNHFRIYSFITKNWKDNINKNELKRHFVNCVKKIIREDLYA